MDAESILDSAVSDTTLRTRRDEWIAAGVFDQIHTSWNALVLSETDRHITLTIMANVKKRRRGTCKISSKNQITIPAEALRSAGLEVGDRVVAHADGAGRVILEREHDVIAEFAGALTGAFRPSELEELRSEWD